ncbi:MAG: ATP-binding protein [Campylobacterota bacterium]|nr:ATP-binding protein [Campylobacterota bacterium]
MHIQRTIKPYIIELLEAFRIVIISGPRQSGKTTLAKEIAKELDFQYYTMDDDTVLNAAKDDPATFVKQLSKKPAVIDEIQMATELVKSLKITVDEVNKNGMFLLTGSADLFNMGKITESLAGRMIGVNLYPFSQYEINNIDKNFIDILFSSKAKDLTVNVIDVSEQVRVITKGGFPDVYNKSIRLSDDWFDSYIKARIEKDLSLIKRISFENKSEIFKLLSMLAHINANLLKYHSLAQNLSIKDMTVKSDIEILEALFLVKRVNPYFTNRGKREVKTPKIHFLDTGLASHLLGVDADGLIIKHREYLGDLVENFIYTELLKHTTYSNKKTQIYHYRDGNSEVDFVLEQKDSSIVGIEVKSSTKIDSSELKGLVKLAKNSGDLFLGGYIFYMGEHILPISKDGYIFTILPISLLIKFNILPIDKFISTADK